MIALQSRQTGALQPSPARLEMDIFDRSLDPALDELAELAAVLSGADYAYLGWMDFNRLWFKARFGFDAAEQPRASTACQWVLESGQPLLITDACLDSRFPPEGLPLSGGLTCRSYAAVPLIASDRTVVGSFAILSPQPERFSQQHLTLLEILGRQAMTRLELYKRIHDQEKEHKARQRAERALSVERCFVAATLDSIPALVAVIDTAGRIVRLNAPCAQLTGLQMSRAVGKSFLEEVLEASDRDWAAGKLRDAANGQVSGSLETNWLVAGESDEKQLRCVSWTLRPLKGPGGEIHYLIVSGQDVTGQRQMEAALLNSEARYRQVVENSLGFIFTCNLDGRLTSLNSFTAETLGFRVEDLLGRSIAELLDSHGGTIFADCLRALENREEWQGAIPLRRRDGIYRRIALRSRRMDLPGEQPFALHHGIDVTELNEAEEALHLAMRQRELILESVDDGIFGIDLDGRFSFLNQAAANLLGYSTEDLIGRDVHESIYYKHSDGVHSLRTSNTILQAMQRGESIHMRDEVFWRQDGSAVTVEYTASPLQQDGEICGMVVAFLDVSERRRLEKMKDEFISTVSHELRTPLTSLRASLGLLSSGALEKRPEKRKQMVDMAIGNCDRLVRLVNDILDFNHVKKGDLPLHPEPVDALNLLRRAADVAHNAATQAHIGFCIGGTSNRVLADEDRILQVLNELVANAIKFSPPNTTISLTSKQLEAKPANEFEVDTPGEIRIGIEDQGRGIDSSKLGTIFDSFQQGDASDSRALGGTGLGLALCRSIVERHGGRIWAESTPGKGARFYFTLPEASGE